MKKNQIKSLKLQKHVIIYNMFYMCCISQTTLIQNSMVQLQNFFNKKPKTITLCVKMEKETKTYSMELQYTNKGSKIIKIIDGSSYMIIDNTTVKKYWLGIWVGNGEFHHIYSLLTKEPINMQELLSYVKDLKVSKNSAKYEVTGTIQDIKFCAIVANDRPEKLTLVTSDNEKIVITFQDILF